jgi:hypothetical protein
MTQMRNAYKILVENSEGKIPLGRTDVVEKIILEWILGKYGVKIVDWVRLIRNDDLWWALVNAVTNLRVP